MLFENKAKAGTCYAGWYNLTYLEKSGTGRGGGGGGGVKCCHPGTDN